MRKEKKSCGEIAAAIGYSIRTEQREYEKEADKMNLKRILRVISLTLAVALLIQMMPLNTFAQSLTASDATQAVENIDSVNAEETKKAEPEILSECVSMRTEDTKYFKCSDGSFIAARYSMPVHYEENGELKDIDNSLISAATDDSEYKTNKSKNEITIPKNLGKNKWITINKGDYTVKLGIVADESAKSIAEIKNNINAIEDNQEINSQADPATATAENNRKMMTLSSLNSSVIYPDVFPAADLQYEISPKGIKESIMVKQAQSSYEYHFVMDFDGLIPISQDDGSIYLTESDKADEPIYVIEAPYMFDANAVSSTQVKMTFEQTGKLYSLKLTAESEWINAPERKFPVTIDPTLKLDLSRSQILDTYVDNSGPNYNHTWDGFLYVGYNSLGLTRTYINFTLPDLPNSSVICNATLGLLQYECDSSGGAAVYANAYDCSSSWDNATITWNNQPMPHNNPGSDLNSKTILDYSVFNSNSYQWYTWDITKPAKRWYDGGTNNGLMLASSNETITKRSRFFSSEYDGALEVIYPSLIVTYRDNKGLEDYWTYHSFSAGTAGIAYINDYTGNLVFIHNDAETTGKLMPIGIDHVYNGYMAGVKYTKMTPYVGHGWKLSIEQTIRPSSEYGLTGEAADDYPYVYTDADGTEHFFYDNPTTDTLMDEDGLGLTLTVGSGSYTIRDDKDNEMVFNASGNLTTLSDAEGNDAVITYSGNRILKVTDGAGHELLITQKTNGSEYIDTILDPLHRATTYIFNDNGKLIRIEYPDNTSAHPSMSSYTYDGDGALLTATSTDGSGLAFTYTSSASGKRVASVTEKSSLQASGQKITFNYSKYNTTVVTTSGVDCIFDDDINTTAVNEAADNLITTYQFDNFGRTVSTYSKASSVLLGATTTQYTSGAPNSTATDIKKLNRVSTDASFGRNIVNLAKNHSAESDGNWTSAQWVNNCTFTFARSTEQKFIGANSYKMVSMAVTGDGRARAYQDFPTTVLLPGGTYTFSANVKTVNVARANAGSYGYGVCVALYADSGATSSTTYSEYITGTTDTAINNGWRRISVTVTLPETGLNYTRANLAIRNASGTAYFDAIQVENSSLANSYNLLENASFENVTSDFPTSWYGNNLTTADGVSTVEKMQGAQAFQLTGNATASKQIVQDVAIQGSEKDTYIVSGWAMANAVPVDIQNADRRFDILTKVTYSDSTFAWKTIADFNTSVEDWQYTAQAFTLDDGTTATKTPVKISIYLRYFEQANTAYFDHVMLTKEAAQSYSYDDKGNLLSASDNAQQNSSMTYDINTDLETYTDAKNNTYNFDYDNNHNMIQAKSQNNVEFNYGYNNYGNVNSSIINNADSTSAIKTGLKHTDEYVDAFNNTISSGAYLEEFYDADAQTTKYNYSRTRGVLYHITDAKNVVTTNTYNDVTDRLETVSSSGVTNGYNYEEKANGVITSRLRSIDHNGFSYGFEYTTFGNVWKSKIGSTQVLATYDYKDNNGDLEKITYGNGDTVEYTYNAFGLMSSLTKNNTLKFTWQFDGKASPYSHKDYENGLIYNYTYDSIDRMIKQNVTDMNAPAENDRTVYETEYGYDALNNITSISNRANGNISVQQYAYGNDNLPTSHTINGSTRTQTYEFDTLNRLTEITLSTSTPIQTDYLYKLSDRPDSGQTVYRTTKIRTEIIGNTAYRYTYDAVGNITKIEQGVRTGDDSAGNYVTKLDYVYDNLGQLTRENNVYKNKTIVYTYDNGGNITARTEYAYTTGTLGTPTANFNYSYTDTNWKDKLTSYNGSAITYDTIGNPLSYRGYTLGWQGRQLSTLSGNGVTASYKYDASGLRSQKTVGGVTTKYQYVGDKLLYENRGGMDIYYKYNSMGDLSAITYYINGTAYAYYVLCNSRGDVEAIYNGAGTLSAKYTYDSWGNVLSITDANGNPISSSSTHVGNINPIRYRGYYYDGETGMYYLQSRYYDPVTGRFINTDEQLNDDAHILGANLFAYCYNNPVNLVDYDGREAITLTAIGIYFLAFVVIALCATAVVTSPGFQRSWNSLCTSIGYGVSSGLNALGEGISSAASWMSAKAKSIAKSIGNSFAQTRSIPKYRTPREIHHIVAQRAPNASLARNILNEVGIGYNSPYNLVSIKTGLHRKLHTNEYYGWANGVVISAYNSANGNRTKQRSNVIVALNTIRAYVLIMDANSPF